MAGGSKYDLMLIDQIEKLAVWMFRRRPWLSGREIEIPQSTDEFWIWFAKNTTPVPGRKWPDSLEKSMAGLNPIIGLRMENRFELFRGRPGDFPLTLRINRQYSPLVELHGTVESYSGGSRIKYSFYRALFAKWMLILLNAIFTVVWIVFYNLSRQANFSSFETIFVFMIPLVFAMLWTLWAFQSRSERDELEATLLESRCFPRETLQSTTVNG